MELSLSVRVAEKFSDKRQANMTLEELVNLAVAHGYSALCMRASQIAAHKNKTALMINWPFSSKYSTRIVWPIAACS